MDNSGKPESGGEEAKAPKIKAEDNPWYLLATLYGVPEEWYEHYNLKDELIEKNRLAWNRYFCERLDQTTRHRLTQEKILAGDALTPISRQVIEEAFAKRRGAAITISLPPNNKPINFSNVEFPQYVAFDRYLFVNPATFKHATFVVLASFNDATFLAPTTLDGATFAAGASFTSTTFEAETHFKRAIFSGSAFFARSNFSRSANFAGAIFHDTAIFGELVGGEELIFGAHSDRATFFGHGASFGGAIFHEKTTFRNATFAGSVLPSFSAIFNGATFKNVAIFAGTRFEQGATFLGATFPYKAIFEGSNFRGETTFTGVTFSYWANFTRATFSGEADFEKATFTKTTFDRATFKRSSSFINARMNGETSFERAIFDREPPRFFEAKLHQGTVWRDITWPPQPKEKKEAEAFIDAYACLKLEMDRLKKHEDELDFFALELQSRRVLQESVLKGSGLPIALYGLLSCYGQSYLRPFLWLLAMVAFGLLAFTGPLSFEKSLGLSVANTFSILGLRKELIDASVIACLSPLLTVFSAVQTIFGTILLFLFGLGVRNKFRMK